MFKRPLTSPLLPAAILLLATVLRLINLAGRPLWYDEAFSLLFAQKSWGTMLAGTLGGGNVAAEEHPLLYYFSLHGWLALAGTTPALARLPSVFFGVVTVGLAYRLGQRLFGRNAGIAAAFISAIAPFPLYYSQEVRMYSLLAMAALGAVTFFVRAWSDGGRGNWLAFALFGAMSLYAHNLGALFLLSLDLWLLWHWARRRRLDHWRSVLLGHSLILLLFAPWLAVLPGQIAKLNRAYWLQKPGWLELVQTLLVFHFSADNQALPGWLVPPALFLSLLLPAWLALQARYHRPPAADSRAFPDPVGLLLFLALGPMLLALAISQVRPSFVIRAFLPSAFAYALLLAGVGVAGPAPRAIKAGLLGPSLLIAGIALANQYTYARFPRPPFALAVATLRAQAPPGTQIIHSNKLTYLPALVYDPTLPQRFIADRPGSPSDTLSPATQRALGIQAEPDLPTAAGQAGHVWLVIFQEALDEAVAQDGSLHPHLAWLQAHYQKVRTVAINDLLLVEFTKPVPPP